MAGNFDLDHHFLLQGIKNHRFLYAKIKQNDSNQILVQERRGMWFSYTKVNENQTAVECYFPYNFIHIIIWIIMLCLLVGFVFLPVVVLMRYLLTKHNVGKVERNYALVYEQELQNIQPNISPAYNSGNSAKSVQEVKGTPPPFNKQIKTDGVSKPLTPPPFPQDRGNSATPPPIPEAVKYYIVFQGDKKGPLDVKTLKEMIALNMIDNNTLVWKEGMIDWKKISEVQF